ncbi:hypothetical protein ACP4OV_016941 [Aristida adscensionis]
MASRMRACARGLVNLGLPFVFFLSLLSLSTRQPALDMAVREEAAAGGLRVFVDRSTPTTVVAVANVTADKVQPSGIDAVAAGDGDGKGVAGAANAKAHGEKPPVSEDAAAAAGNDTNGDADTVVFDFRPYVLVYKSGRVKRFHGTDTVPPGVDALTGVASKNVAGAGGVGARLYLPPKSRRKGGRGRKKKKKLPVLLYFHGGAFVIESPYSPLYHAFLNILVAKAAVVAVSVDYRLAPEHPLPAAYDDAWAALQWTLSSCLSGPEPWLAEHGDATRVFLAGDSAGGNIAHNLAVRAGAERPPLDGGGIAGVVLLNPYFWGKAPVPGEPGEPSARAGLEKTWALVCGGRYGVDDPHVNPLAAPAALRGMAGERVLVTVAGRDGFRGRGAAYAAALRSCGWRGEVEVYVTEGEAHVHFVGNPRSEKAQRETDRVAQFIAGRARG